MACVQTGGRYQMNGADAVSPQPQELSQQQRQAGDNVKRRAETRVGLVREKNHGRPDVDRTCHRPGVS